MVQSRTNRLHFTINSRSGRLVLPAPFPDVSTFGKEKTLKSDDFKVFLHSLELLVEISGIEPLTS